MKRILNIAWLDWRCLLPFAKKNSSFYFIVFMNLLRGDQNIDAVCIVWFVWLSITLQQGYAAAEKNNIDVLYATLGISRSEMVYGRYLLMIVAPLMMGIPILAATLLLKQMSLVDANLMRFASMAAVCFVAHTLYQAVLYPFLYRFGYAKIRNVLLIAVVTLAACDVVFFLRKGFSNLMKMLDAMNKYIWTVPSGLIALMVCALAIWLSSRTSCRIVLNSDLAQRAREAAYLLWGKVKTARYLVSPDGSIFKIESTRRLRVYGLGGVAKLPHSKRRTRTAPELAQAIKDAHRRKEVASNRRTDRRIMLGLYVGLALLFGGIGINYLIQLLFFSASFGDGMGESTSNADANLVLFLFFIAVTIICCIYARHIMQNETNDPI